MRSGKRIPNHSATGCRKRLPHSFILHGHTRGWRCCQCAGRRDKLSMPLESLTAWRCVALTSSPIGFNHMKCYRLCVPVWARLSFRM